MKVTSTHEHKRTETKKLNFTLEHPVTHRTVRSITITVDEAREAIDYLRKHNGNAPDFVKAFINSMEIACDLVWYE